LRPASVLLISSESCTQGVRCTDSVTRCPPPAHFDTCSRWKGASSTKEESTLDERILSVVVIVLFCYLILGVSSAEVFYCRVGQHHLPTLHHLKNRQQEQTARVKHSLTSVISTSALKTHSARLTAVGVRLPICIRAERS
jgi:hypothetical protein